MTAGEKALRWGRDAAPPGVLVPRVGVASERQGDTGESREEFKFRTVYP